MNFIFHHLMSLYNFFHLSYLLYFSLHFNHFFFFINLNIQGDLFVFRLKFFFSFHTSRSFAHAQFHIIFIPPFLNFCHSFISIISHSLIFLLFLHFFSIFNLIPSYTISSSVISFFTCSNFQTLIYILSYFFVGLNKTKFES